ncbi:glycosyltransferase family 2 protein [Thiothrix litoralis]|uniref:Glycosyltransferase family 2 protein n=1 Tax=Thiothrix litoralis TaxID=2891210 RepID=A0ABX7WNH1_9GAMM|nr:glycosyltransferase family 2 protein [Thiothrix litoralis]QTR44872.1 glycosyltransferase family 2 protein [Thiothrix litoralis]
MNRSATPEVAILLCTYNGQHYLSDQLDSIVTQTYPNWIMWVSDDGSQDNTLSILAEYRSKWPDGRLSIVHGPGQGFVANFLSLACRADIQADHYAFCDQDDIWEADKLQRALDWLQGVPADVPALYCSRTRLVDADNNSIGFSPLFAKSPVFANALTQNVGSGNTMVFNHAARLLLLEAGATVDVVAHDWWLYMLVSGCGGKVFYDPYPSLRYRQHDANVVGVDLSWSGLWFQFRKLWRGHFRDGNRRHIGALRGLRARLTPESWETLNRFATARDRWLIPRLVGLKQSGVYRQRLSGNLSLIAAAILKKI